MITHQFQKTLSKRLQEKYPLIQILLGPRQVGKTTAARALFEAWTGPKVMESADVPTPPTGDWIRIQWEKARRSGAGTLLILDEIQKIPRWSDEVKALFEEDRGRLDLRILLLGSSSLYLQQGLKESLAGRFELVRAHHWSFPECREEFGWDFETFLRYGAYPGAARFRDDHERWKQYILDGIIEPVLGKDILGSHPVQKPALFRQVFELAAHYPAQVVSYQKLLGQLQESGNVTTIQNYLRLMEESFLIRCLQKYSGSMVQTRASSPKIIVLDQALINAHQPRERMDIDPEWYGHVFESVVGAHLSRLPDIELFYWREGVDEVDYVVRKGGRLLAIEIKSARRRVTGKGLARFFRQYKKAVCETWNYDRCLKFLTSSSGLE